MKKSTVQDIKAGFMFAFPGLVVFFLVVIIPFFYGFYLTFTDWNGVSQLKSLVGFRNYIDTFKDVEFWSSMWLTLKYVAISVLLVNTVAFGLAPPSDEPGFNNCLSHFSLRMFSSFSN